MRHALFKARADSWKMKIQDGRAHGGREVARLAGPQTACQGQPGPAS